MTGLRNQYINNIDCLDWIEYFIERNEYEVDEYNRKYSRALLSFYKGLKEEDINNRKEYLEESLDILPEARNIITEDIGIKILCRILHIKISYEQYLQEGDYTYYDKLERLIDRFDSFITNASKEHFKKSPRSEIVCRHFIQLFRKIFHYKDKALRDVCNTNHLKEIQEMYNEIDILPSRAWFSKKIEELSQN